MKKIEMIKQEQFNTLNACADQSRLYSYEGFAWFVMPETDNPNRLISSYENEKILT